MSNDRHPDLGPETLPINVFPPLSHDSDPKDGAFLGSSAAPVDPLDVLLADVIVFGPGLDADDRDELRHILKVLKENAPRLAAREDLVRIVLEDVLANTGELVVGDAKGWSRIVLRLPTLQRVMSIEASLRHTARDIL